MHLTINKVLSCLKKVHTKTMVRFSTYCEKVCFLACLILYLQLASSPKSAFASANSTEAEALLKWKASFQNQTQDNLTSWIKSNEAPCNTWVGVSCNSAGSVNRLRTGLVLLCFEKKLFLLCCENKQL